MVIALLTALLVPVAVSADSAGNDVVVVANRGSGDVSVIDSVTHEVMTVDLPGDAQPMYVNHDYVNDLVLVGDRAASTVVALDQDSFEVVDSVTVGEGVFHQWFDDVSRRLWVVGDTSQTVTVVSTRGRNLDVVATIDIPADLVARGGKPHDVFVKGRRAFVSILGLDDGSGVVLKYSTRRFVETGRIVTGGDPHLFMTGNQLYVASQDASTVTRYRASSLELVAQATVPAAHGIFVTDSRDVFVTNITGGGPGAITEFNRGLTRVRNVLDTTVPIPHNITVDGLEQLWVTHSGANANQVSIFQLGGRNPGELTTVTAGTNPFGLAAVAR